MKKGRIKSFIGHTFLDIPEDCVWLLSSLRHISEFIFKYFISIFTSLFHVPEQKSLKVKDKLECYYLKGEPAHFDYHFEK